MNEALTQLHQTCQDVATDLLSQPDFFSRHRDDLPLTEQSLPRPERYTGDRSDDEPTNLRVGAMRMLGFSDRAIERECGVDRRTIPHRLAWLEKTKRIPAVKDRIVAVTANNAETSGLVLADLLSRATKDISTDMAAMIKAVATAHGITVEKLQLLTGSPTEILETRVGAGRDEQEAFWASVRANAIQVETAADDSASADKRTKPKQTTHTEAAGHAPDTSESPDDRTKPAAALGDDGGRGVRKIRRAENIDGSTAF